MDRDILRIVRILKQTEFNTLSERQKYCTVGGQIGINGRNIVDEENHGWMGGQIKMDPQKVGCGGVDGNELAQDRGRWRELVIAVMNLRVP